MYLEYLETIVQYVKALNTTSESIDESSGLRPHVNYVPVFLEGDLTGFLVDEIGCSYQYEPATKSQIEWWRTRPK